MFYCNDCAKENGYPETITKSQGPCECCGKIAICNDMPSSKLPKPVQTYFETETSGLNPLTGTFVYNPETADKITETGKAILRDSISKVDANGEAINPRIKPAKGRYPIFEVPSDGKPKWYGGARCMMFVYSKYKGNFILRGFSDEVEKYLKKNFTHYFYYISMWNAGQSRGYWHFWKNGVTILPPERKGRDKRWQYVVHKSFNGGCYNDLSELKQEKPIELKFKRLPKQWIPEFDQL
jgi:hypothetical protein